MGFPNAPTKMLKYLPIFLLCTNIAMTTFTIALLTNETDRQALLELKAGFKDDPFGALRSWNQTRHFCDWHGVACSRPHQRVRKLELENQMLGGYLSPSLGNLTFLEDLNLAGNNFYGEIPQELTLLLRLSNLNLSQNTLQGEIPANLSHCPELRFMDLSENKLVGRIPAELSTMPKLLMLALSRNQLTGTIPQSFGNFSADFYHFSALYNNLEGSIPESLGIISRLHTLKLGGNRLSGSIPPSIFNLSSLATIHLANNNLHGTIPSNIASTLPNLQVFVLSLNHFTGAMPASLPNASQLNFICLRGNYFTGSLPMNLGQLPGLYHLRLSHNQLGQGKTDLEFLTSLVNCTHLKILDLETNHLIGVLPNSIANLSKKLETLAFGQNMISGGIPPGIDSLRNLTTLSLGGNFLTGAIPASIGKLSNLVGLNLSHNRFSGEIPISFGNLTQLSKLDLSASGLQGIIPPSLGHCQNLQHIDFSTNRLSGTIPVEIWSIPSLSQSLNLSNNLFSGDLPSQLGNLINIWKLDISGNNFHGNIPTTLRRCSKLEYLYMHDNSFHGPILDALEDLKGIQILNLAHNNLSGTIPNYLQQLPFLQNLNLSFNHLEGRVPVGGIFRNASAVSLEGNVKLCGGIQQLNLPACPELPSEQSSISVLVAICITLPLLLCLLILAGCFWMRKCSKKSQLASIEDNPSFTVSYRDILQMTDGFSPANVIGFGSFGVVYKGILCNEQVPVAVKVLKLQERGASKSFLAECEALRNIRHRNLVKIITACSSIDFSGNEFKALVFEFMVNGNLEQWLHPCDHGQTWIRQLSFLQRINIAIDIASALSYLHHQCHTSIVHRDLKPSNVLLDGDMNAHITDFGLAKILSRGSTEIQSIASGIDGSLGYVAPEYGMGKKASTSGDVYSYGILLLEMFTGREPTNEKFREGLNLHKFGKAALLEGVTKIMDPHLLLDGDQVTSVKKSHNFLLVECLYSVIKVGVSCTVESPGERMDMKDALREMHTIRNHYLEVNNNE